MRTRTKALTEQQVRKMIIDAKLDVFRIVKSAFSTEFLRLVKLRESGDCKSQYTQEMIESYSEILGTMLETENQMREECNAEAV